MKKQFILTITLSILALSAIGFTIVSNTKATPLAVKSANVSRGNVSDYLSTNGVVKSENKKDYFGPQGKVTKVNVSVGDKVEKGDVLIEFDVDDMEATVKQAEIQYNNAVLSKDILVSNNKELKNKKAELNSEINKINNKISDLESLEDSSVLAQIAELKTQRSALIKSRDAITEIPSEQLKQADNAVELALSNLNKVKKASKKVVRSIIADFDGVVTNINVVVGSTSTGAQPVCTVQDLEDLKLTLAVGKYDSKLIELGQKATLKLDDATIEGEVSFISPVATTVQGEAYLTADITLNDFHEDLKVEFTEDVDILINEVSDVIRIPMEAVKYLKDGKSIVYVIKDGVAKEIQVTVGVESDSFVEIKSGLTVNDKVILNPSNSITNGTLVSDSSEVKS